MTLQLLLYWLNLRRDVLVSADEVWWSSLGPDSAIARAIRRHRNGLALLIDWSSVNVCPNRDLHRQYFLFRRGEWVCGMCEHLQPWIAA